MVKAITVRNIPSDLAKRLEKLARERDTSLNKLVLELLRRATGLTKAGASSNEFDKFAGTWTQAEYDGFMGSLREQRKIDPKAWK